jgi:hypothetical protein
MGRCPWIAMRPTFRAAPAWIALAGS